MGLAGENLRVRSSSAPGRAELSGAGVVGTHCVPATVGASQSAATAEELVFGRVFRSSAEWMVPRRVNA